MGFWSVKCGTAFVILKREGLWHGTIFVIRATRDNLKKMFMPLHGDILLVSAGVGASVEYRTEHVAEELSRHGIRAVAAMQGHPLLMHTIDEFSVFVFHRTFYNERLESFIQQIKKKGKTIIFETDDLVFDAKLSEHVDHLKNISPVEKEAYDACTGVHILEDPYVQVATTTTHFLAERIEERGKKVFIVPNKLSQHDVDIATMINKEVSKRTDKDALIRIGYFSGSKSHDKDFSTISESMIHILENNKNVILCIAGYLSVPSDLSEKYRDQITVLPFVNREEHFRNISIVDINIVPLERNPFCDAKSEIKFIEAGILHVPTVAVSNPTFSDAIVHGESGFLAGNTAEWIELLQKLIDDEQLRKKIGDNAYKTVMEKYTTLSTNGEYISFLKKHV